MTEFLTQNRDLLTFIFYVCTILITFFFRGLRQWRKEICFDYESKREVARNILNDHFVQRTTKHHQEVDLERQTGEVDVSEIYGRPEEQHFYKELASTLDKSNRVNRYYRYLDKASKFSGYFVWIAFIITLTGILSIWYNIPEVLISIWVITLGLDILLVILSVTVLIVLDGRFFSLVNKIIQPEDS